MANDVKEYPDAGHGFLNEHKAAGEGGLRLRAETHGGPKQLGRGRSSLGDDLEEQFSAAWVDLDVAELSRQRRVEAAVASDHSEQLSVVGGLDEFVDQLCRWL